MVYKINNKEYVLISVPVNNDSSIKSFNEAVHSSGGIIQDWVMMKNGIFSTKIKICVLIPSENMEKFNELLYS